MSQLQKHLKQFSKLHKLSDISALAVAVSGGPDSMALAHSLVSFYSASVQIHCITVDHALRSGSNEEAQQVSDWVCNLNKSNFQHVTLTWDHDGVDGAIMEKARHARYELMAKYCLQHSIESLFVAHHQDDQAETFLIRLAKGSGLDGLSGMADFTVYSNEVNLCRPFLNVSKTDLVTYCQENSIPFIDDPSNENNKFLRPRLRKSMDVLSEEGLTPKRLASTSKRMQRARRALQILSDRLYEEALLEGEEGKYIFDFSLLKSYPEELTIRIIQQAMRNFREKEIYDVRMERLESLFDSLWYESKTFKPRTLGGAKFSLKGKTLVIESE